MINDKKIEFAINNFSNLEKQLSKCMEFIPFIDQNKNAISPKFIPIILEACSLIESIFKEISKDKKGRHNFKKYANLHEKDLELDKSISIFLVPSIKFYQPFKDWKKKIPVWWSNYNKLKHDRLNNYKFATYETAVSSLAGLHQLISRCRLFTDILVAAGWFNASSEEFAELWSARMGEYGLPITSRPIPCESNLFVSPLLSNFVFLKNGSPRLEECGFSQRVQLLLDMARY